jgi:hypothetical protein
VPMIAVEAYLIMELKLEGVESEHHSVVGRCYRTSTYLQPDGSKRWEWATEVVHDPNEHGRPDTESVLSYILIGKRGVELNA